MTGCGVECNLLSVFDSRPVRNRHSLARTIGSSRLGKTGLLEPPRASASISTISDASIRVKLMLAESSGKLDLSECNLDTIPEQVFDLMDLEELSLAGNTLTFLPPDIGRLKSLRRLQLSGNLLRELPFEIGALSDLEGLWLHSNQLEKLPSTIGDLGSLTQLALSGNSLREVPNSLTNLSSLKELAVTGNLLTALPEEVGALSVLVKLSVHGNRLNRLPPSVAGLNLLKELWCQGNSSLTSLPKEVAEMQSLAEFSVADCALKSVPAKLAECPSLTTLTLYGNALESLPPNILDAPNLRSLWAEGNPLTPSAATALVRGAAAACKHLRAVGLDTVQIAGVPRETLNSAGSRVKVSEICGSGPGYFKLEKWGQCSAGQHQLGSTAPTKNDVLVVAFGSAPGVPNWGGLLSRIRKEVTEPSHASFDVLYVVDPHRSWYQGGDDADHNSGSNAFKAYESRLRQVTGQYRKVVMLGDSMGATAVLLFAGEATSVHAFCPQVDLATCSIRPAEDGAWWAALRIRALEGLERCPGKVTVHVGNWKHDLNQVNILPRDAPNLLVKIYGVDSHRLALALDRSGKLAAIVKAAILNEMGVSGNNLRIANLF